MGININKITSRITNSSFATELPKKASSIATSLGAKVDSLCKSDKFSKAVNALEPTGGDNSWLLMLGLMITMVVGPRTLAAAKRNPDNKEATRDEINEILFRDIQTIAVILLAFKALNTIIAAAAGKASGIPMTNKPYQQLFDSKGFKNKAVEFIQEPLEKTKIVLKNIWDTINPLGGKISYTKEQAVEKYSGQLSLDQVKKMFVATEEQNGDPKKIFKIVTDSLIKKQKAVIEKLKSEAVACANSAGSSVKKENLSLKNAEERLNDLINIQSQGYDNFKSGKTQINKATENLLVSFFKDSSNPLVSKAVKLNAWLKSIAYGIEIGYLGFGLPFLNQKRLEKKYLKSQPKEALPDTLPEIKTAALNNVKLKEQEVKLFHNFIK